VAALEWQLGTVTTIRPETPKTKSFFLALPRWTGHRAGQHIDLRLTAPDGYQTQRSYSIASAPELAGQLELTVDLIPDGEVSPYLHDVVMQGDQLELRGPVGGYFVWDIAVGGPLLLVGGGSGVVPLMAMLRHRAARHSTIPARLLYSARTADDVIYREELSQLGSHGSGLEVLFTYTRQAPAAWTGYRRRIDAAMLSEVIKPFGPDARTYVCGPTLLVESVANLLVGMGLPAERVHTERFGPTGS
jgi:ferredoxin-NADP reductase